MPLLSPHICMCAMCHRGRKTTNSFVEATERNILTHSTHTHTHTPDTHTQSHAYRNRKKKCTCSKCSRYVPQLLLLLPLLFFFCTFSRRAAVRQSPVGRFLHCTLLPFPSLSFSITLPLPQSLPPQLSQQLRLAYMTKLCGHST